jgi:hypothetical protein
MTNKIIDDNEIVLIYGLVDPTNDEIRYVGWTSVGLEKRLHNHMKPSELKKETHKNHWIKKLLKLGLQPSIVELEKVLYCDHGKMEEKWIAFYGRDKLTNGTDGGEGMKGWVPSDESRKKMSDAMKKFMQSDDAIKLKENLRDRSIEQWKTEESRKYLSECAKKRWENEDFRNNQIEKHKGLQSGENNPMYGRTRTEEERRKIAEGRLRNGVVTSPEAAEKISNKNLGRKKNRKDMTSLFMGVSKCPYGWGCKIRYNRKTIDLGIYSSELKAAIAYNIKFIELYGDKDYRVNIFDFEISPELLEEVKGDMQRIQDNRNKEKSSKYFGVHYRKDNNHWVSAISYQGEKYYLGDFLDEISAARAYNDAAQELFGWKAKLNIIPESELLSLWLNCTDPTNELP